MSPEDRQELVNLASATNEERAAILSSGNLPIIDLSIFSAGQFGVSRKHAVLQWDEKYVTLSDLKSTNGTRLNGSLLYPMQPRIVRNDDELQLGALQLRVNFRRPKSED
jgi:pSer/pThr/pTyr-binding forkhead associated (FHA) protein